MGRRSPLEELFQERGQIVPIPTKLQEKYIKERLDVWLFAHWHDKARLGSYSDYKEVEGLPIDKDRCFFYHDSRYYLKLVAGNIPLACIGFEQVAKRKHVLVGQIQARRGIGGQLIGVRWEKLLLHVLCHELFTKVAIPQVHVLAAECNKWYPPENKYNDDLNVPRRERMKMHYDVTAKRLGFKPAVRKAKGIPLTNDKPYSFFRLRQEEYLLRHGL